ncbi:Inner membrane transport permease YbhR [Aeoliella mucimassa]|uniref:Inner membrane transport permease YbhR n=2 Tax=Aeoliella mucimassa TaxID=2527972 RepID=A0A518AIF9_9BACT|nr:Inner membrane transport permease YbhR [Aeoliella mucimassa]
MHAIVTMALKDLKLLMRDRLGAFFIFVFPVLMGIFFGVVIGGLGGNSRGTMQVAMVDQDNTEASAKFIERLGANKSIELIATDLQDAQQQVRKGNYAAMIVLPEGFGDRAGALLGEPPTLQLGIDPSRVAEGAMLQGFVMQTMGTLISDRFDIPAQLQSWVTTTSERIAAAENLDPRGRRVSLDLLEQIDKLLTPAESATDSPNTEASSRGFKFEFAKIESIDVTREIDPSSVRGQLKKIRSRWDVSFPQAMMWGVLGCVAGFTISIARERTMGTMVRLSVAPVSTFQVLAGKGLACFLAAIGVIVMMTCLGLTLGMRPLSFASLAVASSCIAFCFVGIMMTLAVLGRTEQSAAGIGWACNLVMAMFGGCMVPVMFMPRFMQDFSGLSPIRWAILALEGAIWRQFTWSEMLTPCLVLITVGIAGILLGTALLRRQAKVAY